mgnify:CR=1 FL=1
MTVFRGGCRSVAGGGFGRFLVGGLGGFLGWLGEVVDLGGCVRYGAGGL